MRARHRSCWAVPAACWRAGSSRLGRLKADLPELRLHLSAGEGDLDPRRPGLDALLVYAEPPWPADMQVHVLAQERIGPVLSPHFAGFDRLQAAPAEALLDEALLHTTSRPQAWPTWASEQGIEVGALKYGQAFEHLYYLLEAAVAGLGWRSPHSPWLPTICEPGV